MRRGKKSDGFINGGLDCVVPILRRVVLFLACLAEEWNAKERQAWHDQHEDD